MIPSLWNIATVLVYTAAGMAAGFGVSIIVVIAMAAFIDDPDGAIVMFWAFGAAPVGIVAGAVIGLIYGAWRLLR